MCAKLELKNLICFYLSMKMNLTYKNDISVKTQI